MKVLIFACHSDDEILGMGGTICKLVEEGHEVHVVVVTYPNDHEKLSWNEEFRKTLLEEQAKVDELLGITRHWLGHPVQDLNNVSRIDFNYSIQEIVNEIDPQIIYTHWQHDLNYQHRLVALATIVAVRPPKKITLYAYEMESSRFSTKAFKPNYYVDISKHISMKKIAFAKYYSQRRNDVHPRSFDGILTHAKYRGHEVGLEYAESFILIKEVVL